MCTCWRPDRVSHLHRPPHPWNRRQHLQQEEGPRGRLPSLCLFASCARTRSRKKSVLCLYMHVKLMRVNPLHLPHKSNLLVEDAVCAARRAAMRSGSIPNPIAGNARYMPTYGLSEMVIAPRVFRPVRAHRMHRIHNCYETYLTTTTFSLQPAPTPTCPKTLKTGWTSSLHKRCFGPRSNSDMQCAGGRPTTSKP